MADSFDAPTGEETIALLEAAIEATRDGILVVDLGRRIRRFNSRFAEMFQLPPDVAARSDNNEILDHIAGQLEDPDALLLRSAQLWSGADNPLSVMRFKDGRVFERFVAPLRVRGTRGEIVGRVVTYHDISKTVRAEQALEQHRAFLEKAQEVAHLGSWVAELDGSERVGWSTETHRIFGIPRGGFAGTSEAFFGLVHPDDRDRVRAASDDTKNNGAPYDVVHRIFAPDGAVRWVHEKADLVCDASGEIVRMVGTAQDITEKRQLEEQLRHAQKLDAIGRLAGGIAHDLNNALTAIAGYTELALGAMHSEHPASSDVKEIRRAAERAASITRQLLAFSRKQRLEPRVFDLNESVAGLGRLLERLLGDDVFLRTSLAVEGALVHADHGQIEQAIINLVVNARDAMPNGGDIEIATSVEDLAAGFTSPHASIPAGTYIVVSVRDTGEGMSADTLAHIFEPFFTTKDIGKGTGLGLAMVYGTVNQSGGFVAVESQLHRGSTFRMYFPPAGAAGMAAESRRPAITRPTSDIPASGQTLLVVEDEDAVRALVSSTLAQHGYRVLRAASAEDALDLATDAGAIDLLLTDANMPGASGIALARMLLAARPDLPVIVMSGYSEEMLEITDLPTAVKVLQKPFTPNELRQRIREVLTPSASSAASPQPPATK